MESEYKRDKFIDYLKSEYSVTSFYYLQLFVHTFKLCTDLVVLDGITIKFLDEGKIKHDYKEDALLALKHMLILSALSKIMVLIESFLSISDSLLFAYKEVPKKMLRYRQINIDNFINKIKKGLLTKIDIQTIYGFPNVSDLPLKDKEKFLIEEVLNHSAEHILTFYKRIVKFYDNHRRPYNKFKHGLSIISGLKPVSSKDDYPMIATLDRCEDVAKMKGGYIPSDKIFPAEYGWYNLITLIPYRDETFNAYNDILSDLKKLVSVLSENHLIRGFNLGTNYLPKIIPTSKEFSDEKFKKLRKIADTKIYPKMYDPAPPTFQFELTFNDPVLTELRNHIKINNIATILMR